MHSFRQGITNLFILYPYNEKRRRTKQATPFAIKSLISRNPTRQKRNHDGRNKTEGSKFIFFLSANVSECILLFSFIFFLSIVWGVTLSVINTLIYKDNKEGKVCVDQTCPCVDYFVDHVRFSVLISSWGDVIRWQKNIKLKTKLSCLVYNTVN